MSNRLSEAPPADARLYLVVEAESCPSTVYTNLWKLGLGTETELFGAESKHASAPSEEPEVLGKLGRELEKHRDEVGVIVTPTNWELAFIRTRFLTTPTQIPPTLSGFQHLSVHDILNQYFLTAPSELLRPVDGLGSTSTIAKTDGSGSAFEINSVEQLWDVLRRIERLVPEQALEGEPI